METKADTPVTKDGMTKALGVVTSKIDDLIAMAPPEVAKQLHALEEWNANLKPAYVVGGGVMFIILSIVYFMNGMSLAVSLASFVYPAYMSLGCIEGNGGEKQWLTYWLIYTLYGILEGPIGFVTAIIPYYSLFKLAMFMYLFHPQTEGATMVYDKFIAKYLVPMIKSPKVAGKKE